MKNLSITFLLSAALVSILTSCDSQSPQNQATPIGQTANRNPSAELGNGGCQYDTQCKGERVCNNGQCVNLSKTSNSTESNQNEKRQIQSKTPENTSAEPMPIEINWGELIRDFEITNPEIGRCDLSGMVGSVYKGYEGIVFNVKSKVELGRSFEGYTAFFFDKDGVEMGKRNVIVETKYGANWKPEMLGRGFIAFEKLPVSEIKKITIQKL